MRRRRFYRVHMTLPLQGSPATSEGVDSPEPLHIATRRVMVNAGIGERYVATGLDLLLLIVLCPLVLGALAVLLRGWWPVGALFAALAYLGVAWSGGQSPGMRAVNIRLVCVRSGRAPGMGRALARAAFVLPPVVALLLLADAGIAAESFSSREPVVYAAMAVLVVGLANELWAVVDPQRRAIPDRVTGLALVRQGEREVRVVQTN